MLVLTDTGHATLEDIFEALYQPPHPMAISIDENFVHLARARGVHKKGS